MSNAIAFRLGNRFKFKNDLKNIYIFISLEVFRKKLYVVYENEGKETSCIIDSLFDIEHA